MSQKVSNSHAPHAVGGVSHAQPMARAVGGVSHAQPMCMPMFLGEGQTHSCLATCHPLTRQAASHVLCSPPDTQSPPQPDMRPIQCLTRSYLPCSTCILMDERRMSFSFRDRCVSLQFQFLQYIFFFPYFFKNE